MDPNHLYEKPILIPGNSFWNIFKRFGKDESLALIINIFATVIAKIFFPIPIILSVAGPIIEKIGFFPLHFYEASKIYKTTNKKQRKKRKYYFKKAVKGGSKSLIEDILIHDPVYIVLMFVGLNIYPGTPVWILSLMSFVIAVFAVSGIELTITEISYWNLKRKMKKIDFEIEKFMEARFLIESKQSIKKLMKKISKEFKLKNLETINYQDTYLENNFPEYSGRAPKVRFRNRQIANKKEMMKTLQVVYTKAIEFNKQKYEQYRYFPIKKEKIYYLLKEKIPKFPVEIKNKKLNYFLRKNKTNRSIKKIYFSRTYSHNKELLITLDKISSEKRFYILELKTHTNKNILIKAMRYVMKEFPVIQTTKNKYEIKNID
jgi:hypothetical protein